MTYNRTAHRFLIIQLAAAKFDQNRRLELATKRALRAYLAGDVTRLDADATDVLRMCLDGGTYIDEPEVPEESEETQTIRAALGYDREGSAA